MLSLRLARRELKGGLGGFRVLLACLALGVATIAAAGSLDAALHRSLTENARALLGGDAAVVLAYRQPSTDEIAFLGQSGAMANTVEMRAMASVTPAARTLVELKAVDNAYPLYGAVTLDPPQDLAKALAQSDGAWGAAADPDLIAKLGIHLGDTIHLGNATFAVRAAITREPDKVSQVFALGPRLMIDLRALPATGLDQPGSLIHRSTLIRLKDGMSVASFRAAAHQRFPDAGWQIRDAADAAPGLQRFMSDITMFLALVGLATLLVGGIGVADAVRAFVEGRLNTIATLKCLGASRRLILGTYAWQVAAVSLIGIVTGLIVGAVLPWVAIAIWGASFPIDVTPGLYAWPLLRAALFGALTAVAFALWPLARAAEVPAAMLFRDIVAPASARIRPWIAAIIALAGIALAALAIIGAADIRLAIGFVIGAMIALVVFACAGRLVMRLARNVARRVGAGRAALPLRIALSSLHRPGAPTTGVILSLGLGLTVLVSIALVEANLSHEIDERLPATAPTFFFIDIPAGQGEGFEKAVTQAGGTVIRRAPMVRGRISKIGIVAADKAKIAPDAQWAAKGDRGLTTAATQPSDARVVAGSWWPADYNGPPLVSLDANIAKGFGLGVGDTITVNVLGREIEARIANLREIDWSNLSMNFTFVMTPNALAGAPYSDIASVAAPPGDELKVERAVEAVSPSASAIRVKEALGEIKTIMAGAGIAIRVAAAVTLLAGALVLAGAIAAGRQRRMRETVIFKVLGARRVDLLAALAIEYLLLGLSAAVVAAALGSGAARELVITLLKTKWAFLPGPVTITALGAVAAVLILGLALTARTLAARAARELRHE